MDATEARASGLYTKPSLVRRSHRPSRSGFHRSAIKGAVAPFARSIAHSLMQSGRGRRAAGAPEAVLILERLRAADAPAARPPAAPEAVATRGRAAAAAQWESPVKKSPRAAGGGTDRAEAHRPMQREAAVPAHARTHRREPLTRMPMREHSASASSIECVVSTTTCAPQRARPTACVDGIGPCAVGSARGLTLVLVGVLTYPPGLPAQQSVPHEPLVQRVHPRRRLVEVSAIANRIAAALQPAHHGLQHPALRCTCAKHAAGCAASAAAACAPSAVAPPPHADRPPVASP
jgi:hypothetical protein